MRRILAPANNGREMRPVGGGTPTTRPMNGQSVVILPAMALALVLALSPSAAAAQRAPGSSGPNIVIDLSVLDDLARRSQGPATSAQGPIGSSTVGPIESRIDETIAIRLGLLPSPRPQTPARGSRPVPPAAPAANTPTRSLSDLPGPQVTEPGPTAPPPAPTTQAPTTQAPPQVASDSSVDRQASGPDRTGDADAMVLSIVFGPGSAIVPDAARDGLRTIAAALTDDPGLRLKLLAYAAKEDQSEVFARRLSLSRSLAVRNFLISSNIEESRITVQALGTQGGDEQPDRVDAYYVRR